MTSYQILGGDQKNGRTNAAHDREEPEETTLIGEPKKNKDSGW